MYEHTQKPPVPQLLLPVAAVLVVAAWIFRQHPPVVISTLAIAASLLVVLSMFSRLTVRDEGQWLAIRYGPLPVFRKRIAYEEITSVEPDRTSIIDGWGIHWVPGGDCTYNLWGMDCVKLTVRGRTIRVGTDDVQNLTAFLRQRIGQ